jgi:hypothetical protein
MEKKKKKPHKLGGWGDPLIIISFDVILCLCVRIFVKNFSDRCT